MGTHDDKLVGRRLLVGGANGRRLGQLAALVHQRLLLRLGPLLLHTSLLRH